MDDSIVLTKTGKKRISKTENLTPDQAIEILQQSIIECQKAGIDIQIVPKFYHSGVQYAAVLMANISYVDGNLVRVVGNDGKGDNLQK